MNVLWTDEGRSICSDSVIANLNMLSVHSPVDNIKPFNNPILLEEKIKEVTNKNKF